MSGALLAACLWALAATAVAFLPMRRQYVPGLVLLCLAPAVLGWLAVQHGVWIALAGLAALVSMFRTPLIYLLRRTFDRTFGR